MKVEPLSREQRRQQRDDLRKWIKERLAPQGRIYYQAIQSKLEINMSLKTNRQMVKPIIEEFGWTCVTLPGIGYQLASARSAAWITRNGVVKADRTIKRETKRVEMTHTRFADELNGDQKREVEADRTWLYGVAAVNHATALQEGRTLRKRSMPKLPEPFQ